MQMFQCPARAYVQARRVNKMALGGEPEEPEVAKAVIPSMPRRERKAAASSAMPLKWGGAITQGPLPTVPGQGCSGGGHGGGSLPEDLSAQGVPAFLHAGPQMVFNPCISCFQAARFERAAYPPLLRLWRCRCGAENHCW